MLGSVSLVPMPARVDVAIGASGHGRDEHDLLMIAAVVVHDGEQRDLVMRRGPQHAGSVVQIAVVLDVDGQAAVFLVGQRRAHRRRSAVADAVAALSRRCTDSACRSSTAASASG